MSQATACQMLHSFSWKEELDGQDVEKTWAIFLEDCHVNDVIDKTVLKCHVSGKLRRKKWVTKRVESLIKLKQSALKAYRHSKTKKHLKAYQKVRNQVTSAARKAKFDFQHKLASKVKGNPRAFVAYARSQTSIREEVTCVREEMVA